MAFLWSESGQRIRNGSQYARLYGDAVNWNSSGSGRGGPYLTGSTYAYPVDPAPSGNEFIAGVRHMDTVTNAFRQIVACGINIDSGLYNFGQRQVTVLRTTGGGLEVRRGDANGVLLDSVSGIFLADVWYYVAVHVKVHGSAGFVRVWVDGALVIEVTDVNTQAQGAASWNSFAVGHGNVGWHDFYVLDATNPSGNDPHEVILDARVDWVAPDGDGYLNQWTRNGGSTNYERVNQNTPDDDTTYVERTAAGIDAYTLGNAPSGTIVGVTTFGHGKKTDGGVAIARTGLHIGSTNYFQTNNKALATSYQEFRHHWGHDPSNGAWNPTVFNAAELLLEKV